MYVSFVVRRPSSNSHRRLERVRVYRNARRAPPVLRHVQSLVAFSSQSLLASFRSLTASRARIHRPVPIPIPYSYHVRLSSSTCMD